jgi:hypothetical protein
MQHLRRQPSLYLWLWQPEISPSGRKFVSVPKHCASWKSGLCICGGGKAPHVTENGTWNWVISFLFAIVCPQVNSTWWLRGPQNWTESFCKEKNPCPLPNIGCLVDYPLAGHLTQLSQLKCINIFDNIINSFNLWRTFIRPYFFRFLYADRQNIRCQKNACFSCMW